MSLKITLVSRFGGLDYDVDLAMPAPGISALLGPSGAGKSTLLRVIAGLERIPGATVSFDTTVWQNERQFVPPHERQIGFVFQDPRLFSHLDVMGNIEFAMRHARESDRKIDLAEATELLGIDTLLQRDTKSLSGGEKQRVAIARAIALNPRLLLMDEPLSAVDVDRSEEILPFIERLHDHLNIPVLYVSHNTDEVARLADFLVSMESGKVLGHGPLGKMLTRLDLPMAMRADAEAVLVAKATGYESAYRMNTLSFSGGALRVLGNQLPAGQPIRVRIAARDVSLTLQPQEHTSILNILPAIILERVELESAQTLLRLQVGEQMLLSRITRLSADTLNLSAGDSVYAQVKSIAVLS